jgi:hypothetical protein
LAPVFGHGYSLFFGGSTNAQDSDSPIALDLRSSLVGVQLRRFFRIHVCDADFRDRSAQTAGRDGKLAGLQLFDGADSEGARVTLFGTTNPTLTLISTGKKQQTTLGGSGDGSFGLTFSGGSTPAGFLGTKADGKGYLELNDSSGSKMVEAGSLDKHKGYVLTTPYHASVSPQGDPSVLLGGSGR